MSRTDQKYEYCAAKELSFIPQEEREGARVHLPRFPALQHLKFFRIQVDSYRTEYVVTNDLAQIDSEAVQKEDGLRSRIEQLHTE